MSAHSYHGWDGGGHGRDMMLCGVSCSGEASRCEL